MASAIPVPAEPSTGPQMTRSAGRPGARMPTSRPWAFAVLPVAMATAAAGAAPLLIAQRLLSVRSERKEDELGADRLRRREPVEMLLLHAGDKDHGPGIDLGAAPADAPGGGRRHHRERGDEVRRQILVV